MSDTDYPKRFILNGQTIRAKRAITLSDIIRSQVHPEDYDTFMEAVAAKPEAVEMACDYILWGD